MLYCSALYNKVWPHVTFILLSAFVGDAMFSQLRKGKACSFMIEVLQSYYEKIHKPMNKNYLELCLEVSLRNN